MKFTRKDKRSKLEREIEAVLETMNHANPSTENYQAMANNLDILYKAKANEKTHKVSPDTIAIIAGNLLGIALILGYERANIITSKAIAFVMKGRV